MSAQGLGAHEQRLCRLPDGRALGFSEYGDPAGEPVFYSHGWPGSRLEARLIEPAALLLGARVLAPDRPGYGLSDDSCGRTLLGWSRDVAALADVLGIGRFSVLGVSGGGPYAFACASALRDRVRRAVIVCGVGLLGNSRVTEGMPLARRIASTALRFVPWTSRAICFAGTRGLRRDPIAALRSFASTLPSPDKAVLQRTDVRDALVASLAEGLSNGIRGVSTDLGLYFRPWDFDLRKITAQVSLWHGGRDVLVPADSSLQLGELIPAARLTLLPEAGHYSLPIDDAETILADLLARSG